jgi:hypothetical protein
MTADAKKTTGNTTSYSDREEQFLQAIDEWHQEINQKLKKYGDIFYQKDNYPDDIVEAARQTKSEEYQKLQDLIVEKIEQLPDQRLAAISIPKGPHGTLKGTIHVENITGVYVIYDKRFNLLTTMPGNWLPENELSDLNNKLSKFNNSSENENAILEVVSHVAKKYRVPIIHGFITMSLNDLEVLAAQLGIGDYAEKVFQKDVKNYFENQG